MWLLIAFLVVPLIEIALFIQVGGLIGLWATLAIVVVTAVAGSLLVRSQGRRALERLRGSIRGLRDPSEPLAHGAMILFSGALLLTPGFFTDAVGFALLIPGVRRWVLREAGRRVSVSRVVMGEPGASPFAARPAASPRPAAAPRPSRDTVEGEWTEVPPEEARRDPPSGWTRR